jgi:hypothetical protein
MPMTESDVPIMYFQPQFYPFGWWRGKVAELYSGDIRFGSWPGQLVS